MAKDLVELYAANGSRRTDMCTETGYRLAAGI